MRRILPALLAALLLVPVSVQVPATAREPTGKAALQHLLNDIETQVRDTRSVQCSFEQERNLAIFAQPVIFTGRMVLSRPDRLRWENIAPIPSVLIFNGREGQRCNDDAPPVHFDLQKDPVMNMVARQIWTWVDGNYDKLQEDYNLALTGDDVLELSPKPGSAESLIAAIRITFDRHSLQPRIIRIDETGGDSTVIRFSDYQLNRDVDNALFTTCFP